jgi:hypothetical protein
MLDRRESCVRKQSIRVVDFADSASLGLSRVDRIDQFNIFKLGAACKAVEGLPNAPLFMQAASSLLELRNVLFALDNGRPLPVRHCKGELRNLMSEIDSAMSPYKIRTARSIFRRIGTGLSTNGLDTG